MPSKEISDQQASPDSSKDTLRGAHPAEVRLSEPVGVRQQPADCFFAPLQPVKNPLPPATTCFLLIPITRQNNTRGGIGV